MDTKRILLTGSIVLSALFAGATGAQTIYKQIDEDGRISFTDQPRESARTVASYQTPARSYERADSDYGPLRTQPPPRLAEMAPRSTEGALRSEGDFRQVVDTGVELPAPTLQNTTPSRPRAGEVERAIATYSPLASPLAAQADIAEAARRARQEATLNKEASAKVLVVQPVSPDRDRHAQQKSLGFFYALWVGTFILLAAGLLYFGWRVLELILGRAFPTWNVGAG
jgi:hypothetical protein